MSVDTVPATSAEAILIFGPFEIDPRRRRLLREGRLIELGARAFDILMVLLEAHGQVVSKHELLNRVWPTTVVGEHNIHVQICALRKALGDNGNLILTDAGRGYRLAAAATPAHLQRLSAASDPSCLSPRKVWPTTSQMSKNARKPNLPPANQSSPPMADSGWSPALFGRFCLIPSLRVLLSDGIPVALGARAFDVLAVLIEARGALVTKSKLLNRVWPRMKIKENTLQAQISALRRMFGESRDLIVTESGRGYRFAAEIRAAQSHTAALQMLEFALGATGKGPSDANRLLHMYSLVGHKIERSNAARINRGRRIRVLTRG